MVSFDRLLQAGDTNAICESWFQLTLQFRFLSQPRVEPASVDIPVDSLGGGAGLDDGLGADVPQVSSEGEEALRSFMSEWSSAQEGSASADSSKQASELSEASAKRSTRTQSASCPGAPSDGAPSLWPAR
eukprot:3126929-Pyramimonas_sp.AAC.1